MTTAIRAIDRIAMHRFVLLGLLVLLVGAFINALTISDFAISASSLLETVVVSVAVTGVSTYLCAALWRVPPASESWLITALILTFIFDAGNEYYSVWGLVVAAAIAGASRYVVAVARRHIFNPAAFGAAVVTILGYFFLDWNFVVPWWIGNKDMLWWIVVVGVLVVLKLREVPLVAAFLIAASITHATGDLSSIDMWRQAPTLFLAVFMLTEPLTSPNTWWGKLTYGALVGWLANWGEAIPIAGKSIEISPEIALSFGCVLAWVLDRGWRRVAVRVTDVRQIGPGIVALRGEAKRPVRFRPGQWAQVTVPRWAPVGWLDNGGSRRVLSLASVAGSRNVEFAFPVGAPPSRFKQAAVALTPGQRIYLDEIGGGFTPLAGVWGWLQRSRSHPVVLVAGGIGITPFISVVATELSRGRRLDDISLVVAARDDDRLVYRDLCAQAAESGARVLSVTGAAIDGEHVRPVIQPGAHYYLSGPPVMIAVLRTALTAADPSLRLQRWRIHTDRFLGY